MAGGQVASGLSIDGEMGGEGLNERAGEEGQWPGPRGGSAEEPQGPGTGARPGCEWGPHGDQR